MSQFSAQEPSLGYHYQVRYSLYLLLKARDKVEHYIKLENLDDIEVGDLNKNDVYQTKFHNSRSANLTDSSEDIWKTIRVWSELVLTDTIDLDNIYLILVTTTETSEDSILYELTGGYNKSRNIANIVNRLDSITKKSKNQKLESAFIAYNKLSTFQKEALVKSIHIKDNSYDFENLKKEIQKELQLSCLPEHIDKVYHELEGWWYEQCIQHLQGKKPNITYDEARRYLIYVNNKLNPDDLLIDNSIRAADVSESQYDNMTFVNQLKSISMGEHSIKQAKRDFYRASEQRSKWIREQLLNPQEEIEYDLRLHDDWQSKFSIVRDDIESQEEDSVIEKCKSFYTSFYGTNTPLIYIRPRVTDPFLVKGSCHMLADKNRIAWHPKFLKE